ncbi:unnamed protein product [Oncorhynchus mykiss]|uniref:PAS domain-containing protein n=1 Tax=Oncorhynchus mykiss TaxID=8022 RepID=A0A060VMM5_ONCMY|nr:unnamed protein product [Oncorhynchus mykiss]
MGCDRPSECLQTFYTRTLPTHLTPVYFDLSSQRPASSWGTPRSWIYSNDGFCKLSGFHRAEVMQKSSTCR